MKILYYICNLVKKMAKPIGVTPDLYGENAERFIRRMFSPPTEEEKKYKKNMYDKAKKFLF